MSSESQKDRKGVELSHLWNNDWKFPKFGKRHKPTESRSWAHPKPDKPKEIHAKIPLQLNFWKWKTKEKFLKVVREKWHLTYRGKVIWMTVNFSAELWRPEGSSMIFFQCWKKKTVNPEFYTLQKYSPGTKRNQNILRWRKTKELSDQQTYPNRMVKVF